MARICNLVAALVFPLPSPWSASRARHRRIKRIAVVIGNAAYQAGFAEYSC